jgi:hypothetical protein
MSESPINWYDEIDIYMSNYDVDDAWPIEEPIDAEDCLKKLVILSHSGNQIECHGVDQNYGCIRSTLDIRFEKENISKKDKKMKEISLLETYVKEAYFDLPPEARRFIDIARLKWNTFYNTGTLFIGRHYRLPTRCIDLTVDPFIALFFACYNDSDKPGVNGHTSIINIKK